MMQERAFALPALPLPDIGRNGNAGASDLCGQSEPLVLRKTRSDFVDLLNQGHRIPPNLQVTKRTGVRHGHKSRACAVHDEIRPNSAHGCRMLAGIATRLRSRRDRFRPNLERRTSAYQLPTTDYQLPTSKPLVYLPHLQIGVLKRPIGPNHVVCPSDLLFNRELGGEALARFVFGDAVAFHHSAKLNPRIGRHDDDFVEVAIAPDLVQEWNVGNRHGMPAG